MEIIVASINDKEVEMAVESDDQVIKPIITMLDNYSNCNWWRFKGRRRPEDTGFSNLSFSSFPDVPWVKHLEVISVYL